MAENSTPNVQKKPVEARSDTHRSVSTKILNEISKSINEQKNNIEKQKVLLRKTKSEQDKNVIQEEIDSIQRSISDQTQSFEIILTSGLQLNGQKSEKIEFNWQKDLLEIVQPIMNELHELTAVKRELNRLKQQISFYDLQIHNIRKALNHMLKTDLDALKPAALSRFQKIQEKWQSQLKESEHLLEVAQLQHDEVMRSQVDKITLGEQFQKFLAGRGITLLMAITAFFLVFLSMKLLWKLITRIYRHENHRETYIQRVIAVGYHVFMVVLSIVAVFYVFNTRNDQVLTAIGVLLLFVIIWALKSSIPGYIAEIQTFLHAGPVREGERIVYNGVPMQVGDLNFHTKLTNPDLPGLVVRLPLSELLNYVSRPSGSNEPWFPCKQGDFVLLSDGMYGMIKSISIESVVLSLSDGRMPKTYMVSDFLAASPRNLSQGFFVISEFGIDYQYQENCTTQIPEIFRMGIQKGIQRESFGSALLDLTVQFSQANASSLDYKIFAKFDGKAASDYYPIIRALQRYAVEVCNQQQWEIPFAQLTIHRQVD
ncbi:MAG: hypothetical protein K0U59_07505 [Gammaproteobacteria bacterium]|nr:hypothetical protein [Gammaproteobacteria bacterium]